MITRRHTGWTAVPLEGQLPAVDSWFPEAVRKGAPPFSRVKWQSRAFVMSDDAGNPTEYGATLTGDGGAYKVEVRLPLYREQERFTKDDPLRARVSLQAYKYRSHPAHLLLLGRYPDGPGIAARKRVMNSLRKSAKRAVKSSSKPSV